MTDIIYGTAIGISDGYVTHGAYSGIAAIHSAKIYLSYLRMVNGWLYGKIGIVDDAGDISVQFGTNQASSSAYTGQGIGTGYLFDESCVTFFQIVPSGNDGRIYQGEDNIEKNYTGYSTLSYLGWETLTGTDSALPSVCSLADTVETLYPKIFGLFKNLSQSNALYAYCGRVGSASDLTQISADVATATACCPMESDIDQPIVLGVYVTGGDVKVLAIISGAGLEVYTVTPGTATNRGTLAGTGVACAQLDIGKAVVVEGNKAYIVTTNGSTTPSFGAEVDISAVGNCENVHVAAVDHTHFVVVFEDAGDSHKGKSRLCTVSGTVITQGQIETFCEDAILYPHVAVMNDYNGYKIAVSYCNDDNGDIAEAIGGIIQTVSRDIAWQAPDEMNGTSVEVGAVESAAWQIDVCDVTVDSFAGLIRDLDDANAGKVTIAAVASDDSITWGALSEFCAGIGDAAVCRLSDSVIVTAYSDTGNGNDGYCRIGQVQGDKSVNWGTAAEFYDGDVSQIALTRITDTAFAITYVDADSDLQLIICTVSGTTITPGTPSEVSATAQDNHKPVRVADNRVLVFYGYSNQAFFALYSISGTTLALLDSASHTDMDINPKSSDMCTLKDYIIAVALGGYAGRSASATTGSGCFILNLSADTITIPAQAGWTPLHRHGRLAYINDVRLSALGTGTFFACVNPDISGGYPTGIAFAVNGSTITRKNEERIYQRQNWSALSGAYKDFVYHPRVCVLNNRKPIVFYASSMDEVVYRGGFWPDDARAMASVGRYNILPKERLIFASGV